jgi:hypothetical protein
MPLPTFRTFSEVYGHDHVEDGMLKDTSAIFNDEIPHHPEVADEHTQLWDKHKETSKKFEMPVRRYTGSESKALNTALIHKGEPELIHGSLHKSLLQMHEESPALEQTHHVYSSTGAFDPGSVIKEDGVFTTPAHTSTTLHPGLAAAKANATNNGVSDQHIIHFELPSGYKHGTYIAGHSQYRHEKEYLIKPNTKWKLKSKSTHGIGDNEQKRHIWHVVPHEDDLHEAASHTDGYFNGKITYGYDSQGNHGIMQHVGWSRKGHEFSYDHQDVERQHKQLVTQHRIPSKDEDAVQQIKDYTAGSSKVNRSLIKPGLFSFGNGPAKKLSGVIGKYTKPLQHDTHVYSGLSNFDPSDHFRKGKGTIHLPAFTSTSLHPSVALNFAPHDPETGISHIIHFHLPTGYKKGLYIDGRSHVRGEREMLLDKGQTWKLKEPPKQMALKVGYKNLNDPRFQNHTREVTLWSVEPHNGKLNEALEHEPKIFQYSYKNGWEWHGKPKSPAYQAMSDHYWGLRDKMVDSVNAHHKMMSEYGPADHELNAHVNAFKGYTGDESGHINKHLLGMTPTDFHSTPEAAHEHWENKANMLEEAIHHYAKPLDHEAHVYSGIGGFDPAQHFKHGNGVIHMPSFVSSSIDPETSYNFAHKRAKAPGHSFDADHHIIHFHLPKGYKNGAYIDNCSLCNGEKEYLLNRDQRWKLKNHTTHNYIQYSSGKPIKKKVHVWSVEPHNDELHELKIHDPSVFHQVRAVEHDKFPKFSSLSDTLWAHASDVEDRTDLRSDKHHNKMAAFGPRADDDSPHVNAIKKYTSTSRALNNHLAGVGKKGLFFNMRMNGRAKKLDAALQHYAKPLDHVAHVYSGVGGFSPAEHFKQGNGVIHTPAYTSTSLNPLVARTFARNQHITKPNSSFKSEAHVIHFRLPKGFKNGAYISNVSDVQGEHEYLLHRNQKWKLVGHSIHNDVTYAKTDKGRTAHVYKSKVHVWSVVPHDENIHELFDHKPDLLHLLSMTNKSSKPMPWAGNVANQSTRFKRNQASELSDQHHTAMREFGPNKMHLRSEEHAPYAGKLREYTDDSFSLNDHLLGNTPDHDIRDRPIKDKQDAKEYWDGTADAMSQALHHFAKPLNHQAHVYSGLGTFDPRKQFHEGNGVIHMPAFVSTSLNPHIARGFAQKQAHWDKNNKFQNEAHIIHFKLPEGYKKGVYMNNVSVTPGEHEYLLDKGQKWKLTGHSVHNHVELTKHDGGHMRASTKVHVWSVVPHHDDMKEAYEHDPSHFHDVGDETHANFASMGSESHPWDDKEEHGMHGFNAWNRAIVKARNEYHDSDAMKAEHKELEARSREHYNTHGPGPYDKKFTIHQHGLEITDHGHEGLLDYTAHSKDLNHGLIALSRGHEHSRISKNMIEMNAESTSHGIKDHAAPLKQTLHVYSGTGTYNPGPAFKEGNGIIHTPTFISSSISPHVAKKFARGASGQYGETESHVLHFELPEGYKKGAYIAHTSEHPKEHEFLLDRNQHWKLKSHQVVTTRDAHGDEDNNGSHMKRHIWTVVPHDPHLDEAFTHDPSAFQDVGEHPEKNFVELGAKKYADLNDISKKLHAHSDWYGRNIAKPAEAYHATPEFNEEHEHLLSRASAHYEQHGTQPLNHKIRDFDKSEDTFGHPAIAKYTGYSKDLNKTLVKLSSGEDYVPDTTADLLHQSVAHHRAETVSQALKEHAAPLTQTLHVYSGLKGYHPGRQFLIGNGIIHTPAFTSTSISPHISKMFSLAHKTAKGEPESHILHFELPAGYNRGAYIAGTSHHPSEHEFLLDRNQLWKLKGHHVTTTRDTVGTSNYGQTIKRHVWTVVPHDPDEDKDYGMHEAYDHDDHPIKNNTHYSLDDLDWNAPDSDEKFDEEGEHLSKLHATDHPESHQALDAWSGSSHAINQHLIHGKELYEDDRKTHEHMQRLINTAAPLDRDHHVYSSFGRFDPSKLIDHNKTFATPAYTSTSLNPEIASAHAHGHGVGTHMVHFHLPKGYKGTRYIAAHSQYPHERELVLGPGKKFKMVGHETYTNKYGAESHLWHAVPHEDDLHEALEHHPSYFRSPEERSARWYDVLKVKDTQATKRYREIHRGLKAYQENQTELHHDKMMAHLPRFEDVDRNHYHAINSYTSGSNDMNSRLIHNYNRAVQKGGYDDNSHEDHYEKKAVRLTRAINALAKPLDHEAHVYSGLRNFNPTKHFEHGNGIIHMPAFVSTTISPPITRTFEETHEDDNSKHIIHFKLPKGYKNGVYIHPYSDYSEEHEFLLDRGQNWKLVHKHTTTSKGSHYNPYSGTYNHETEQYEGAKRKTTKNTRTIWTVEPYHGPVKKPYKNTSIHPELSALGSAVRQQHKVETPSLAPSNLKSAPKSGLSHGDWEPDDSGW